MALSMYYHWQDKKRYELKIDIIYIKENGKWRQPCAYHIFQCGDANIYGYVYGSNDSWKDSELHSIIIIV